jgi:CDGSH-type Zn-finger protein
MPFDPVVAARSPAVLPLLPGTYHWCRCGLSKNQPFCDSSHAAQNTGIQPLEFVIDVQKPVALCRCKRTGNAPFCDGSHNKLPP